MKKWLSDKTLHRFFVTEIVVLACFILDIFAFYAYVHFRIFERLDFSAATDKLIYELMPPAFAIPVIVLFPVIFFVQLILFVWWKLYKESRYIKKTSTLVVVYFMLLWAMSSYAIFDSNNPYYQNCSTEQNVTAAVYGYSANEIKTAFVSEYRKGTDFTVLIKKIELQVQYDDPHSNSGYLHSDSSLSADNDWLYLINDSISYKITEQCIEPIPQHLMFGDRWQCGMASYVVNGVKKQERSIRLETDDYRLRE